MNNDDKLLINIGFDDIDSPKGGCTTHFVAKLAIKWNRYSDVKFIDYPNLIRFLPSIPWKTRGNGGLALRLLVPDEARGIDLFEEAIVEAEEYTKEFMHPESHPSLAAVIGEPDHRLKWLGEKAVKDIIPLDLLKRVLDKIENKHYSNSIAGYRGLIGAYSAIGLMLKDTDYTYELIAYRIPENWGKDRRVDPESVKKMDKALAGKTFLNYDYEVDKPLITPHGPDPVLLGIRGEEPEYVYRAYNMLIINEPVDFWVIFRTNQATDMHLRRIVKLSEAYIYTGIIALVRVSSKPRRIHGGHVVFKVTDGEREVDVAVYEPTGKFRDVVEKLVPGDLVEIYGTVRPPSSRHSPTVNLEKIRVVKLALEHKYVAPRCPRCSSRMKSMGKGKGYRCKKCSLKIPWARKIPITIPRRIKTGFYQPPPRSFKHLMKPIERLGKEKTCPPKKMFNPWYKVY